MLDQGSFNFSGGQAVTRDIDDIINTTPNPVIAFVIPAGTISGELRGYEL